jgi:hypothetical protein
VTAEPKAKICRGVAALRQFSVAGYFDALYDYGALIFLIFFAQPHQRLALI